MKHQLLTKYINCQWLDRQNSVFYDLHFPILTFPIIYISPLSVYCTRTIAHPLLIPQTRKRPLGGREVWRLWAESSAEPSPRTLLEAPAALDTEQKKLGSRRSLEAEEEGKEGTNLEEDHVPGLQHLPPVFSLVGFHGDRVGAVADDQVVHLGTQSDHLIFVLVFKDKLVNRVLKSRTISG